MQKFYLIPRTFLKSRFSPILLILIIDEPNKPDVSIGGWREGTFIGSSSCLAYTNQLLPPLPGDYHNVFTWPTMIHPFRYDRPRYTLLSCIRFNRQCNEQSRVILIIRHVCLSIVDHHNQRVWAQHYRASNHTRFYARSSNHVKTLPCTEYVTISFLPNYSND